MRNKLDREREALLKRAIKASVVAVVVFGGVFIWQSVASGRNATRAEQARIQGLQLSPQKAAALEREAARDAATKAFAEKQAAEQQARLQGEMAVPATVQTRRGVTSTGG